MITPLIVALILALSAVEHGIRGQILNGMEARMDQFKYMVLIFPKQTKYFGLLSTRYRCGGTIIGSNWVLTAAHCLYDMSKVYVLLGAHIASDAEILYKLQRNSMVVHPEFNFNSQVNDIALLQIPMTKVCEKIDFALLPFNSTGKNVLTGKIGLTMGWGRQGDHNSTTKRLHWTETSIMSNEECQRYEPHATHSKLCVNATRPHGSPCPGDSGGPLILKETGEQIGIVSKVIGQSCESGNPVIFTRVRSYLPWISEVTGLF